MKKKLCLLVFVILILLCACGRAEANKNMEFPGTSWDMTPEEVLEAYGISKEETGFYEEDDWEVRIRLDNIELFGQTAEYVFLSFADFSYDEEDAGDKGICTLCGVNVLFAPDSDMETVKKELERLYGTTIPEYYHFTALTPDQMRQDAYKESANVKYWGGSLLKDVIPGGQSEEYKENWKFYQIGLNDDNWDFFRDNARAVVVIMADNEGENGKIVSWNAMNLAIYRAINSKELKENN